MTSKVILKKSSVSGRVPTTSDLDYGELAINYADGKIYYKNSSNSIAEISGGGGAGIGTLTVRRTYEFTATSGQTTFVVPDGYVQGNVEVIVNGSFLANSDFTATNGTSVVLTEAAVLDDLVHITVFDSEDSYTKIESDAITTNLTNHAIAMAIALG
jgi:hypothetical protein